LSSFVCVANKIAAVLNVETDLITNIAASMIFKFPKQHKLIVFSLFIISTVDPLLYDLLINNLPVYMGRNFEY